MSNMKNTLNAVKKKITLMVAAVKGTIFSIKIIPIILLIVMGATLFNWIREIIHAKDTAQAILEALEVQDLSELVTLAGNDEDGYYWTFVDDVDERLDEVIEALEDDIDTLTIDDKEMIKKMAKAELVTQYPDLGGETFSNTSDTTYTGTDREKARQMLEDMSIEEKISQMLFVVTSDNNALSQDAGGYILVDGFNFSQTSQSISNANNDIFPVFAVDEEGGTVQRIFDNYPSARSYGDSQDYTRLEADFTQKSRDLLAMGINMNLAPVADVSASGSYMDTRSFSSDYEIASVCVETAIRAMMSNNMMTSLKHFPGYGNNGNSHDGEIVDDRSIEEIQQDMNVFKRGVDAGASTITVSHIKYNAIDDENPASLSTDVINYIRNTLNYDGVVMTDALNMDAVNDIENKYEKAILAGNDVLEVTDFNEAKNEILSAYRRGDISEDRINKSVERILAMKFSYGLINEEELDIEEDDVVDFETGDSFQGTIHLRRVMPDKEIGELVNVSTGVQVDNYSYVTAESEGLGTKEDIPDNVKEKMDGISMNGISGVSYEDLSYLTIPYYDFDGNIKSGHMVVNKDLADEVLLIFQELYNNQYPIESMEPVEEFSDRISDAEIDENDDSMDYGVKLDKTSMYFNNTSSFNDRATSSGGTSYHATGCAIDLNPKINPWVSGDSYSPSNAQEYTDRSMNGWSETEKAAVINENSKVYEIFTKYGWTWGGSWENEKDYQHFEKQDMSKITIISSIINRTGEIEGADQEDNTGSSGNTNTNGGDSTSGGQVAGDGEHYVVAIDAGHGEPSGAQNGLYKTGTQRGDIVEWEYTRKVADAVADKLSIYSNLEIVRIGNTDENPCVENSARVNMAKNAGADMYVTIHYNGVDNASASGTETYHKAGDNISKEFADILVESVSSSLGIPNRGSKVDTETVGSLIIIKNSNDVGFPCVCIEGGYVTNDTDYNAMVGEEGIDRYAEGVAAGILQYCGLENKGYGQAGSSSSSVQVNSEIRSRVFDLKYVSNEKFQNDLEEGNLEVLEEFTMDEDGKITIATWSYDSSQSDKPQFTQKQFQASDTYTQKYTMPMEYLLAYYIDTDNKEFVNDLADLAMDSEFVLAIQDNVTTTQTDVSVQHETVETIVYQDDSTDTNVTYTDVPEEGSSVIRETVSTNIELTYGDTWFMKFYKDVNYSSTDLSSSMASNSTETGEQGEDLGNFKIGTYCRNCNQPPNSLETESGNDASPNHTIAVTQSAYDGDVFDGKLKNGSKVIINGQVFTVEDVGESPTGDDNWIGIFIDGGTEDYDACNDSEWVSVQNANVYVAENVSLSSDDTSASDILENNRVDTVISVKGNSRLSDNTTSNRQRVSNPTHTVTPDDPDIYERITTVTKITTTRVQSNAYTYATGEMHVLGNEQKFINICRGNERFQGTLKVDWLITLLEQQPDTVNMIDLTKYLLYRATNQNYDTDVNTFDFYQYAPEDFTNVTNGIYGGTPEEALWFSFIAAGYSEESTAGVMGNIFQESGFNTSAADWTRPDWSVQYLAAVDSGTISRDEFIHDGQGFGIAGFTYHKCKAVVYDLAKDRGKSVTDVEIQVEALLQMVDPTSSVFMMDTGKHGYSHSDWLTATSPEEAALAFLWTYEKPNDSDARAEVRTSKAREYYNQFHGRTPPTSIASDDRIGQITLSGENATKMAEMLTEALRIADDDRYTYSQANRYGEFQYDCSSFVSRLYKQYFDFDAPGYTGAYSSYNNYLIGSPESVQLQPGDVLFRPGHVEIYLGNNMRVGAHTGRGPIPDQISAKSYTPPGNFTAVYRFIQ